MVNEQTVGYYWTSRNGVTPHFTRPTGNYGSMAGQAYLKLSSSQASGLDDVYTNLWPNQQVPVRGDIDASGAVDVDDLNIIINIMLGKALADDFPGNADIDNSGSVDVDDLNIIINIMLGKG